jgi:hypothetical protein
MPVNAEGRKHLTELVAGESSYDDDTATNYKYATVTVGNANAGLSVDNIGIPLVWVDGNSRFEIYVAQNIATAIGTGTSPLAGGTIATCITVGDAYSKGFNKADTDIGTANAEMTVVYRGFESLLESGLDATIWAAATQPAYIADLEANEITFVDEAASAATTAYTS